MHFSRLITIMTRMRQLPHQNYLIRYNSAEFEAGFANITVCLLEFGRVSSQ